MNNRVSRQERIQKLSRRNFGRFLACGAAAAAMAAKARADLPIPDVTVNERCRQALTLINEGEDGHEALTIGHMIKPLAGEGNILQHLCRQALSKQGMEDIAAHLANLDSEMQSVWDEATPRCLYATRPEAYRGNTRDELEMLSRVMRSPWLALGDDEEARSQALNYIDEMANDDFYSTIPIVHIYTKGWREVVETHEQRRKLHEGLDKGVWDELNAVLRWSKTGAEGHKYQPEADPNGKCWSQSEDKCCLEDDKYCRRDGDLPTSASDDCGPAPDCSNEMP